MIRAGVELRGGRLVLDEQLSVQADLADAETRQALAEHALGDKLAGGIVSTVLYVGPEKFYQAPRELPPEQRDRVCMTSVNYINHLYDHRFGNQRLKAAQRVHSRFINSYMMYTLNGAAVSTAWPMAAWSAVWVASTTLSPWPMSAGCPVYPGPAGNPCIPRRNRFQHRL